MNPQTAADSTLTYSVEEAGRLLGLSRTSAYAAARNGQLPTLRIGARIVIPKAALHRMLDPEQAAS